MRVREPYDCSVSAYTISIRNPTSQWRQWIRAVTIFDGTEIKPVVTNVRSSWCLLTCLRASERVGGFRRWLHPRPSSGGKIFKKPFIVRQVWDTVDLFYPRAPLYLQGKQPTFSLVLRTTKRVDINSIVNLDEGPLRLPKVPHTLPGPNRPYNACNHAGQRRNHITTYSLNQAPTGLIMHATMQVNDVTI